MTHFRNRKKIDYDHHLDQKLYERGSINTALLKGEMKGEAKGLAKGLAEGEAIGLAKGEAIGAAKNQEQSVLNANRQGIPVETISIFTGLTPEQITEILKRHEL